MFKYNFWKDQINTDEGFMIQFGNSPHYLKYIEGSDVYVVGIERAVSGPDAVEIYQESIRPADAPRGPASWGLVDEETRKKIIENLLRALTAVKIKWTLVSVRSGVIKEG